MRRVRGTLLWLDQIPGSRGRTPPSSWLPLMAVLLPGFPSLQATLCGAQFGILPGCAAQEVFQCLFGQCLLVGVSCLQSPLWQAHPQEWSQELLWVGARESPRFTKGEGWGLHVPSPSSHVVVFLNSL